jgi:large subunit ribosomal protein L7Ae
MDVPYVIVKGKSRLGSLVHKKTAAVVAVTNVNKEDTKDLSTLTQAAVEQYNKNPEIRKAWGGQKLGPKAVQRNRLREKAIAKERIAQ